MVRFALRPSRISGRSANPLLPPFPCEAIIDGYAFLPPSLAQAFHSLSSFLTPSSHLSSINTPRSKDRASTDPERRAKFEDPRKVIEPDSIAKVRLPPLPPLLVRQLLGKAKLMGWGVQQSYWYLHEQDPSAWTQELDLRPAHEKW